MPWYAHSLEGRPETEWETQQEHAKRVAEEGRRRAAPFGAGPLLEAAGLLHDIGKCSAEFQAYLRQHDGQAHGPDHSTAGAVEARRLYPGPIGRLLAFVIAGHHAGLADGADLEGRLGKILPSYAGWEAAVGPLPAAAGLVPKLKSMSAQPGFTFAFLGRMLFSCLVDADSIATESFYARAEGHTVDREGFSSLATLNDRLKPFMAAKRATAEATAVNGMRASILDHMLARTTLAPGLFTLTVPTGGGKTLASLSFALEHALAHGLRRVVYVVPFSSIVEQTADVFRTALGVTADMPNAGDVLEHHATFDWEAAARAALEDGRGTGPAERLRRATENWAAPVVVTTAVQFFESLFSNRRSRCRKLHNLANSVIILDEAQTLPQHLLRPCLAAIDELARNYSSSVVLCTATQPAVRTLDGFDAKRLVSPSSALNISPDRELAPDPARLHGALRRFAVERLEGPVSDAEIAARFAEQPQMLCIVNTRAHAQTLFDLIRDLRGAVHLSTLMCPAHRRAVLGDARRRLRRGEPVRIVSTSLIEAGVDIDLPEVWRAAAGLENIAQAGGRANREGRLPELGRVVVFEPADVRAPREVEQAWQAARNVLRRHDDPLAPDAMRTYFQEVYWQKGPDALDAAKLDGSTYPILDRIAEHAPQKSDNDPPLAFPFASIAGAFRIIDEVMEPVIVPWSARDDDDACESILRRVAAMNKPLGPDLRKLQQYVVSIPRQQRAEWLAMGVVRPVHTTLADALLRFEGLEHYDREMGVKLGAPLERSAASNIFS